MDDKFLKNVRTLSLGFGVSGVFYYLGYRYYESLLNTFQIAITPEELLPSQEIFMWGFEVLSPAFIALFLIYLAHNFIHNVHSFLILYLGVPKKWLVTKTDENKYLFMRRPDIEFVPKDPVIFADFWSKKASEKGIGESQRYLSQTEFKKYSHLSIRQIFRTLHSEDSMRQFTKHQDQSSTLIVISFYLFCLTLFPGLLAYKILAIFLTFIGTFIFLIFFKSLLGELWDKNIMTPVFYGLLIWWFFHSTGLFINNQTTIFVQNRPTAIIQTDSLKKPLHAKLLFENNQNVILLDPHNGLTKTIPKRNVQSLQYQKPLPRATQQFLLY